MFIGHFAVGLASKRVAPKTSLGLLIAAPILLDLLWPVFLLSGWEHVRILPSGKTFELFEFTSYPYSHSLEMSCLWGLLFAGGYWALTRYRTGAIVIFFGVVSHWVLDVATHLPDMPITVGGRTKIGLALWNSVPATVAIEGAMFVGAVWLYARTTTARDGVGRWSFWAFVALLVLMYVASIFGGPPPSVQGLAIVALTGWLFPVWAWWFDRHRDVA